MSAGVFGYLAYDMVRLMERLPPPKPEAVGVPDAILIRPRVVAIFDAVKDELTVVTPVRPEAGVARARRLRPRRQPPDRRHRRARPPARPRAGAGRHRAERRGRLQHDARRIQGDGGAGEGLHRRRRHFSGGAVAALRGALPASRLLALPRAPPREPLALPLFPRLRRFLDRRLKPGNPGPRARRRGDRSARSPARARAARRRRRTSGSAQSCSPTRRSAPST